MKHPYRSWVNSLATILHFASLYAFLPFLPLHAQKMGASPVVVGMVVASQAFLPLLLAVVMGGLTDRIGHHRAMIGGTALVVLSRSGQLWAGSVGSLALMQTFGGLGELAFTIAQQALLAALPDVQERKREFGWYNAAASGGMLLGPLAGGLVVNAGGGYHAAFGLAAGLSACALVCTVWLWRLDSGAAGRAAGRELPAAAAGGAPSGDGAPTGDREPSGDGAPGAQGNPSERFRHALSLAVKLLRDPFVLFALITTACVVTAMGVRETFLPITLNRLGYDATVIGFLVSFRSVATVLSGPLLALFQTWQHMAFGGLALAAATGIAISLAPTLTWSVPLMALAATVEGITHGVSLTLAMTLAAGRVPEAEGMAVGMRLASNRLMKVVVPMGLGVVLQVSGERGVYLAAGGAVIAFGVSAYWIVRRGFTAPPSMEAAD